MKQQFEEEKIAPVRADTEAQTQAEAPIDLSEQVEREYQFQLSNAKTQEEIDKVEHNYWEIKTRMYGTARPS